MGYLDSFSAKGDRGIAVVSVSADSRRFVNRTARLGHDVSDIAGRTHTSERSAAVQYCISNDLI